MKVFIKTLVADELPDFNKTVCTDKGNARYFKSLASWQTFEGYVKPKWWLKEIEIPDENSEEITNMAAQSNWSMEGFREGANFILNKLNNH